MRLFPWHRRQGSHVPHRSLVELRAAYTPDAARSVSGHPPSLSRRKGHPAVLTSPNPLSTLQKQFACARLSRPCLPGSSSRRFRDAHDHGFWPQPLAVAWDRRPDRRTRRALLHLQYSCASPCGPVMLVTQDPIQKSWLVGRDHCSVVWTPDSEGLIVSTREWASCCSRATRPRRTAEASQEAKAPVLQPPDQPTLGRSPQEEPGRRRACR